MLKVIFASIGITVVLLIGTEAAEASPYYNWPYQGHLYNSYYNMPAYTTSYYYRGMPPAYPAYYQPLSTRSNGYPLDSYRYTYYPSYYGSSYSNYPYYSAYQNRCCDFNRW